jgi:hypothetical protein
MKVSTVMNAIPRYTHHHWVEDLRFLAEQSLQLRTLPFAGQMPLPENINIVRNKPEGAINTQKLELKAACLGIERLTWLFGADAEFIGLTLRSNEPETAYLVSDKSDCNPVLLLAKIRGRKSEPLDAQYAYFIEEFTGESIIHCAKYLNQELTGNESIQDRHSRVIRNILYSLQDYDSGISHNAIHIQNLKNIRNNSKPGTAGFVKARSAYQSYAKALTPAGKTIFNSIRTYIEKQKTAGNSSSGNHSSLREAVYAAFPSLLENPASLSKIWFDAGLLTHGLSAPQFNPEPDSSIREAIYHRKEADHDR